MFLNRTWAILAMCAVLVGGACSSSNKVNLGDGSTDALDTCDPLAQTRCNAGEKCTWIFDATAPTVLGHVGCVPDGSVALNGACGYGPAGPMGYDDCAKGGVCVTNRCVQICDQAGGAPSCAANFACQSYANLFDVNSVSVAGVCDPVCDPLQDNDFDGSGPASARREGSPCNERQGCYGFPGRNRPTVFSCSPSGDPALVHRSLCTVENRCQSGAAQPFINGCAPGYTPLMKESTGSSETVCVAFCKPQDCYLGNCPNGQLGEAPYSCKSGPAVGTFAGTESCLYSWVFERDGNGRYIPSPTSDTVGFCVDHAKYTFGTDMAPWPNCSSVGIGSEFDAAFFGCISTKTASMTSSPPFAAAARVPVMDMLRQPYRAVVRANN